MDETPALLLHVLLIHVLLNAALLLGLVQLLDLLFKQHWAAHRRAPSWGVGLIVGIVAILVIELSVDRLPAVIFDASPVLFAVAGLLLGSRPTLLAVLIAVSFRLWIGGATTYTGIIAMLGAAGVGMAACILIHRARVSADWRVLLALGAILPPLFMLSAFLSPDGDVWSATEGAYIQLLLLPPLTVLFGVTVLDRMARIRALREIRDKAELFDRLFSENHVAVLVSDPDSGAIVDANDAAIRYYGWSREQLCRMSMADIVVDGPSDPAGTDERNGVAGRTSVESRHRRADGGVRDVQIFTSHTKVRGHERAYTMVDDVGERVNARRALEASEQRLERIIGNLPDVVIIGHGNRVSYVNSAGLALLGATEGNSPIGHSIDEIVLSDARRPGPSEVSRDGFEAPLTPIASGCLRRLDARMIPIEMSRVDYAGEIEIENIVLCRDVRWRHAMERRRTAAELRYRAMVEQSITGVCIVGIDGRLVYLNPRACEILMTSPQAMVGKPFIDVLDSSEVQDAMGMLAGLFAGVFANARREWRGLPLPSRRLLLRAQATLADIDDQPVALIVFEDVADRSVFESTIEEYVVRLEATVLKTAQAMSRLVELRDPYTAGHQQRVGEIAAAIAAELGEGEHFQAGMRIAGALHDVGKMAVPAELLTKPVRLSAVEYALVQTHAENGWRVLEPIDFPWPIAETVRQHHERFDGSGYPRGLAGEAILREARILAVADVVESMANYRPYRPQRGLERALDEIEQGSGTRYDPIVVAACLKLFREHEYRLPQ